MSLLSRIPRFVVLGAGLVLIASLWAGCSDDDPTTPDGGNRTPTTSNISFDRLGAAVIPGGSTSIEVMPLAGALEPITVTSSDPAVATVSSVFKAAASESDKAGSAITVVGVGHGTTTITVSTESGDKREFPVTVYDPMVLDTGEMLVKFTDQFGGRFHDAGSGADWDGDFYMPIAPDGYYPLGGIGFSGYQNPVPTNTAVIVVKDKGTNKADPPLKAPVDYEIIWHNGVGTSLGGPLLWYPDGSVTGAFWRPVPPEGYVALGLAVHNWTSGTTSSPVDQKPPLDAVMCVREDLTQTAKVDGFVWHDGGNGLSDRAFRADQLLVPDEYVDYESMHIAPGTFAGNPSHAVNDNNNPVANVLKIKPQILVDADYKSNLWRPTLHSLEDPGSSTQPLKTKAILVPFTAFVDAGRDVNWKVANSPFYRLERTFHWDKECLASGLSDCSINYITGSTTSNERTNWQSESVEASKEAGFELKGIGGKMKTTVTKTMGFVESVGVSEFFSKEVSSAIPAPGEGSIIAAWKAANRFSLFRHNGLALEQVVSPWTMYEDSFHSDKFP